jgi:hypothetical protein
MYNQGPLDFLPLWVVFALTIALVLLTIEAGFRIGRRRAVLTEPDRESSVGAMTNASLALLAFLLAFTFGFAASRLDARRTVLLDEVNAIGTTYLRAATLPEPERTNARTLLRDYVDARLAGVRSGNIDEAIGRSENIQAKLWDSAAALAERSPGSIVVGLYLQALNEMIDLHTKRLNEALRIRIPAIMWIALYLLTAIAMLEVGFQMGLGGRRRVLSTPAFAVAFATVMFLIMDLDRPQMGWIQVSQQPMVELRQSMAEPPR